MDRSRDTDPIEALFTRQDGVAHRAQLIAAGLSPAAIDSRLRRGRLLALHEQVVTVGHRALGPRGRWRAALLAVPGSVLGNVSAGAALEICRDRAVGVELLVTRHHRHRPGLVVHRTRTLPPDHVTSVDGLACVTAERVLRDMAAHWPEDELLRVAGNAEVRGRLNRDALLALDLRGLRGAARLRAVQEHDAEGTRSELAERFRRLCAERRLPMPVGELEVAGRRLDFAWPELRFGVECQSWRHHTGLALEAAPASRRGGPRPGGSSCR